jgi:hypothetical protein
MVFVVVVAGTFLLCVFGLVLVRAGTRAGDQAGDAAVTAWLGSAAQPDENRPVVVARVRNPADVALLAGFSVRPRRVPDWLGAGMSVSVPRRTARRRFRPGALDVVGVVPAGGVAEFTVPAAAPARAYRLIAVIGQGAGRLRVFRMPLTESGGPGATSPSARSMALSHNTSGARPPRVTAQPGGSRPGTGSR